MWTPTPPLSGWRTPRPGPMPVGVCVPLLAGSGGSASRKRFAVPHLCLWRVRCALCLLGPLRAGVALFVVFAVFFLFFHFFFCLSFCVPRCLWRLVFPGPGCLGPWRLAFPPPSPPQPFFFPAPPPPLGFVFFLPAFSSFFVCCVFFPSVACRFCGAGLICVPWAVGCAGACCCVRCAPTATVCACAVSFGALWLCLSSLGCCLSCCACPVAPCWRCFSSPCCLWCPAWVFCPLVPRRLRPVVALGWCVGVALLRQVLSSCSALRWCVL